MTLSKSVAILIIGSLIWNKSEHRQSWRRGRLVAAEATRVRAPIRYGRLSRGNTYTMVFSHSLVPDDCGWALAVPCSHVVDSLNDLALEAQLLWAAEQTRATDPGPLAARWGAVGLLCNPQREDKLGALAVEWSTRIRCDHAVYKSFPHAERELPAVTPNGLLSIPWPTTESGNPFDSDFLLATATVPRPLTGGAYATPREIADAWKTTPERKNYFDENRRAGIITAFDGDILRFLAGTESG